MPRSKIIYAWNYLEWGGAEIYTLGLIKYVSKVFDIVVLLPEGSSKELQGFLQDRNIRHEFFTPPADMTAATGFRQKIRRRIRNWRSEMALVRKIVSLGLANSIVHIDLGPQQSLLTLARLCRRAPVFFTAHNSLPTFAAWHEMIWRIKFRIIGLFKNFHIFCANVDTKRYLSRFVSRSLLDRISITPVGVDPEEIDAALSAPDAKKEVRVRMGISDDRFVVLTVGQFIDRKGRWILLEGAKRVLSTHPNILFLWLMPQLPSESESERIKEFDLGDSFRPILSSSMGVTRNEILRSFRVGDIFVLPSLLEGLPISLLEAMALGVPGISTNINAIPEAVENGRTGILVPPGDPNLLATSIIELHDNERLRKELAASGREFVTGRFTERATAAEALKRYQTAVSGLEANRQSLYLRNKNK